ncbi:hypothetical protein OH807_27995 [Kitasatospora sp. NBC_01560]|uniref:hypothetical protein n=1 Tax=Kitasatospora sp. NBC_01560 TaxID=2975965 RepID=UPI00386837F3
MPEQKTAAKPAGEVEEEGRRRIDLSVAQVAASALATVVGAVLASELGVYGTILGAAVVSVGATTGSAVFQHVFRRTGEQWRGAVERTGPGAAVNGLRQVPGDLPAPAGAADAAAPAGPVSPVGSPALSPEWNAPQVVRVRRRWTWKTYTAVSGLVFVLAMVPIVGFELATGQPVSATVKGEAGSGTSLGGTVRPKPADPSAPAGRPSGGPTGAPTGGASASPGKDGGASAPAVPDRSPGAGSSGGASPSQSPGPTPSAGVSSGASAGPSAGSSAGPSGGATASGGAAEPSGAASPNPPAPTGAPAAAPSGATVG